jgi:uncharacterized protein YjbI with pentapeptide repeats
MRNVDLSSRYPGGFTVLNLANLERADLSGSNMQGISAVQANFRNANLTDVDLTHAVVGGAIMRRARVTNANFDGVELATVSISFANFSQARNASIPSYKAHWR